MKKVLFLATIAALAITSCSKDKDLVDDKITDTIEFRTLTDKGSSKAAITDETSILSFTVAGIKRSNGEYLFNGFGITRGENSTWDYTPKRYWPTTGTVDFYAYSPSSSKNVTKGLLNTTDTTISYKVPQISTTNAQEDFLVARLTGQDKSNASVKLNFHHALSRVMFFAKTTQKNITYTIDKIELINLYEEGSLALTKSSNIPGTGSIAYGTTAFQPWTSTGNKVNYTVDMGNSPIYLLNDYASVLGKTNAVMVLPQATTLGTTGSSAPVAGEFAVKVSYKAFVDDQYYAGTATTSEVKYFAVTGSDGNALTFEMGRQYNFYLEFGDEVGDPIKFEVGVSDWNNAPNTYLPEITNYKSLISDELKGYAEISTTKDPLTLADLESITTLTISITANGQTPNLTGLEYLPVTKITVNTGNNGSNNPAYTCPKLDLSKCSGLTNINFEYKVTATLLIVPDYFPKAGGISTGNGNYTTCQYPDGTVRPR